MNNLDCFKLTDDGFWKVRLDNESEVSVPSFTGVILGDVIEDRQKFTIIDGVHSSKNASISLKYGNPFVGKCITYYDNIELVLKLYVSRDQSMSQIHGILETPVGQLKCMSWGLANEEGKKIILDNVYKIKIPDFPHKSISRYNNYSKFYRVWFGLELLVGYENFFNRYLHFGSLSWGCVSCISGSLWTSLVILLLRSRLKNSLDNVGLLKVNYI
ncbi:hypothetical protein [Taylorella equigenitalis]|uniref:hypothetical protein n=1 Tax=Taylorella equigenitalis TaxID=29575 RepID=UPI00237CECF8|nr:hypothetical protein [Taylorella equigenitalis]WDU54964.1 hypothetical protein KPZ19_00650 [Taylorella equigenitalis]